MKKVLILILLALPFGLIAQGNGVPNRGGNGSGYNAANYDHEYLLLEKRTSGEEVTIFSYVEISGKFKKVEKYESFLEGLNKLAEQGYFVVFTENSTEDDVIVSRIYLIKSTNKLDRKKESKK